MTTLTDFRMLALWIQGKSKYKGDQVQGPSGELHSQSIIGRYLLKTSYSAEVEMVRMR